MTRDRRHPVPVAAHLDLAAVMDFADFDAARAYVQHPLHQTFIRDHVAKVVGERVIVQHDWTTPSLS